MSKRRQLSMLLKVLELSVRLGTLTPAQAKDAALEGVQMLFPNRPDLHVKFKD